MNKREKQVRNYVADQLKAEAARKPLGKGATLRCAEHHARTGKYGDADPRHPRNAR
jgi:hypothetical protein